MGQHSLRQLNQVERGGGADRGCPVVGSMIRSRQSRNQTDPLPDFDGGCSLAEVRTCFLFRPLWMRVTCFLFQLIGLALRFIGFGSLLCHADSFPQKTCLRYTTARFPASDSASVPAAAASGP